mgnify:CR=1 FL=1
MHYIVTYQNKNTKVKHAYDAKDINALDQRLRLKYPTANFEVVDIIELPSSQGVQTRRDTMNKEFYLEAFYKG